MKMPDPSPIQHLEGRLSRLARAKVLTFSTFCAQATVRNVDVYLNAIRGGRHILNDRMNSWFWERLGSNNIDFPEDYETVERELIELTRKLAVYPSQNNISPAPNSVMARESIFLFISNCYFFAARGKSGQLLAILNNCISCKIDFYYRAELGIDIYKSQNEALSGIRSFPAYHHALADLNWVIGLLEEDDNPDVSEGTLGKVRSYAQSCPTFIVDRPFFARD